jgi:signal transduction histidine kinase
VAADSDGHSGRSPSELAQRFAVLMEADRKTVLVDFAKRLEDLQSPVSADPGASEQAMAIAAEIVADIVTRVRGEFRGGDHREMLSWLIGAVEAESQLSPADLLRAVVAFFDVAVSFLARHVRDDPELLPCFVTAVLALNESIGRRVSEATVAYTGYLLERVDKAHIEERLRIARDLHDRLGEGLSIALRQIELFQIDSMRASATAVPRATLAKQAVTEAMGRLRAVTTDLRQDSVRNLETALVKYLDSVAADAEVRLRVSGDETWAPPSVIDEAYQIIREALRNAFTHGSPKLVLIGITIAPHELFAWVQDDGCGFETAHRADPAPAGPARADPARAGPGLADPSLADTARVGPARVGPARVGPARAGPARAGTGLAAMRERAASIGGRLTLDSAPGQGTYAGLVVPLPGHHDERSR